MLLLNHHTRIWILLVVSFLASSCGFPDLGGETSQVPRDKEFVQGNRYRDFTLANPLQNAGFTGIIRFDVPVTVSKPESFLSVQNATLFSPRSSAAGSDADAENAQIIIPIRNTSDRGYCNILAFNVKSSYRKPKENNILPVQGSYGFHFSYSNSCLAAGETGYILAETVVGGGNTTGVTLSIESFSYSKEIFYQPDSLVVPTKITAPVNPGNELTGLEITLGYKLVSGDIERELFILSDSKFFEKNISNSEKTIGKPTPVAIFFDTNNRPIFYTAFFADGDDEDKTHLVMENGDSKTLKMPSQSKVPLRNTNQTVNRVRVYSAFSIGDTTKGLLEAQEQENAQ